MICPNCKSNIPDDSKFCPECGAKVVKTNDCPKCGARNLPKDSKFCPDCGAIIKNIDSLRIEANSIVYKYPKGYKALVEKGVLPVFTKFLSLEECERIIGKKYDISKKQEEIDSVARNNRRDYQEQPKQKTDVNSNKVSNFVDFYIKLFLIIGTITLVVSLLGHFLSA